VRCDVDHVPSGHLPVWCAPEIRAGLAEGRSTRSAGACRDGKAIHGACNQLEELSYLGGRPDLARELIAELRGELRVRKLHGDGVRLLDRMSQAGQERLTGLASLHVSLQFAADRIVQHTVAIV
jgi:hypothetical protein